MPTFRPYWVQPTTPTVQQRLEELSRAIAELKLKQQNTLDVVQKIFDFIQAQNRPTA